MSAVILSDRSVMVEGGELVFTESDIVETLTSAYKDSFGLEAEDVLEIEELVASLFDALEEKNFEDDNMGLCDLPGLEVEGDLAKLANFLQEPIDPVGTAIRRIEYQQSDLEDELALSKNLLDQIDEIEVYVRNASVKTPAPDETLLQSLTSLIADRDAGYVRLLTVNRVLNEEIKELNAVVRKLRVAAQPTAPFNPAPPTYPASFTLQDNAPVPYPAPKVGPAIVRHNLSSIPCGKDCIQWLNAA